MVQLHTIHRQDKYKHEEVNVEFEITMFVLCEKQVD